jgi:uncharacterized membrane protein YeaQ/YmgE (transglycosylase-associated protein family)
MNIVLWLTIGGVTGAVLSLILHTGRGSTLFRNALVGAISALAAGWLSAPFTGQSASWRAGDLDLSAGPFLAAFMGALVVVLVLHFLRDRERPLHRDERPLSR